MSIHCHCRRCFRNIKTSDEQGGKTISCPDCQAKVAVPNLQPPLAVGLRGGESAAAAGSRSGLPIPPGRLIGMTCLVSLVLALVFALIPSGDFSGVATTEHIRVKYAVAGNVETTGIVGQPVQMETTAPRAGMSVGTPRPTGMALPPTSNPTPVTDEPKTEEPLNNDSGAALDNPFKFRGGSPASRTTKSVATPSGEVPNPLAPSSGAPEGVSPSAKSANPDAASP